MAKYIFTFLMACCSVLLQGCGSTSPEKYLDKAVLNSGAVAGFAGSTLSLELKNPVVKIAKNGTRITMKRQDIIKGKIRFSKKVLRDLRGLSITPDVTDILSTSIGLHEFLIEVYETDYMELAKLYDEHAAVEKINALDDAIKTRHASMFELHYENLIRGGKLYAAKHNIALPRLTDRML